MKYDLRGHPMSCKTTFMPKSFNSILIYGPVLMKICMNKNYVMEKFCDFFTLRPFDLIITLTYVLMETFVLVLFYSYLNGIICIMVLRKVDCSWKHFLLISHLKHSGLHNTYGSSQCMVNYYHQGI